MYTSREGSLGSASIHTFDAQSGHHALQMTREWETTMPSLSVPAQQLLQDQSQRDHLLQQQNCQLLLEQGQQLSPQPATEAASLTHAEAAVWWTQEMLDLTAIEFKALLDSMGLGPKLMHNLKVARRKMRNRMFARRSRERQLAAAGERSPTRLQYSHKIGALKTTNSALRSRLGSVR
jgi:hypothetical protein